MSSILEDLTIDEVLGEDYIDAMVESQCDAEDSLMFDEDEELLAVLMSEPAFEAGASFDYDE